MFIPQILVKVLLCARSGGHQNENRLISLCKLVFELLEIDDSPGCKLVACPGTLGVWRIKLRGIRECFPEEVAFWQVFKVVVCPSGDQVQPALRPCPAGLRNNEQTHCGAE